MQPGQKDGRIPEELKIGKTIFHRQLMGTAKEIYIQHNTKPVQCAGNTVQFPSWKITLVENHSDSNVLLGLIHGCEYPKMWPLHVYL